MALSPAHSLHGSSTPTPQLTTKWLTKCRLSPSPFLPLCHVLRQVVSAGLSGSLWGPDDSTQGAHAGLGTRANGLGPEVQASLSAWCEDHLLNLWMDGLGPQSSLNMTDRWKGLGKNHGAEQEGHSGPFLRALNRAQCKNETSPCGEAPQSLLSPLGPLRGQAAHLQASPHAHKPQHWPRGSPKHGEPSHLIPQTSKSSVGYTMESSARTTSTSLPSLLLSVPV